jgi:hypothetical protein
VIENLDHFNLIIKNWPNDVPIGCDGITKPKSINGFLCEAIMIEKNKKLMEYTELFEEEYEAI